MPVDTIPLIIFVPAAIMLWGALGVRSLMRHHGVTITVRRDRD